MHGRYRVLSLLGRGGMGVVYQARDLSLGRDVAVKVVRAPDRADLRVRFRRETQLASRVHHPHAVYVVDAGELPDGSGFLVMELLKGRTLRAVLAECGRMEPQRACRIGAMIASGMQSVHEAGIVHRDLKPANVFLLDAGGSDFVKIVDFGVARELDLAGSIEATAPSGPTSGSEFTSDVSAVATDSGGDPSGALLTRQGAIVGTLRYMAPEQIRGDAIDARVDQYALGCMLYEMLTGVPPFSGEGAQVARGHLYGEPIAPRQLAPEAAISPGLEAVVLRALSRRREARFAQMRELAAALTRQAASAHQRPARPQSGRLRSVWRALSVAALAALTATAGAALIRSWRPGVALERTVATARAADAVLPPQTRGSPAPSLPLGHAAPPLAPQLARPEAALRDAAAVAAPSPLPRQAAPRAQRPQPADPETVPAALARATTALHKQDPLTAQRLLLSLRARCGRAAPEPGCAEHAHEVAVQLGRLYEAEGHWAEALTEYRRALPCPTAAAGRESAWCQEAEAAAVRLMPRLGRVLLQRSRDGRCEEVSMFLPPGEHVLAIDGESRLIRVSARETQRLGSCASP